MSLQLTGIAGAMVGLALIAGSIHWSSPQEVAQEANFLPPPGPMEVWTNEIPLSEDGVAVLNNSFFSSGIYRAGATSGVSRAGLERVISLASYVTVNEEWEPELVHSFLAVDANGTGSVSFLVSYRLQEGDPLHDVSIQVTPLLGKTWGEVRDINDLSFLIAN